MLLPLFFVNATLNAVKTVVKPRQGVGFYLTNAVASQTERFADFFKRFRLVFVQAITNFQNHRFLLVHILHRFKNDFQTVLGINEAGKEAWKEIIGYVKDGAEIVKDGLHDVFYK